MLDDAGRRFGVADQLDLAAPVAVDGRAGQGHQGGEADQPVTDRAGVVRLPVRWVSRPAVAAASSSRMAVSRPMWSSADAPILAGSAGGSRTNSDRGPMSFITAWARSIAVVHAARNAALALPCERLAAFGADLAVPPAVVDLAERGENLAAGRAVHLQDRGEVLDDQDALVADAVSRPPCACSARSLRAVADSSAASPDSVDASST